MTESSSPLPGLRRKLSVIALLLVGAGAGVLAWKWPFSPASLRPSVAPQIATSSSSARPERSLPAVPPKPRTLAELTFDTAPADTAQDLFFDGEERLLLFAALTVGSERHAYVGFSDTAGESFKLARHVESAGDQPRGAEQLRPVFSGDRIAYAVRSHAGAPRGGVLFELDPNAHALKRIATLPNAPPIHQLVTAGSPVVVLKPGLYAAVYVPDNGGKASLSYFNRERALARSVAPNAGSVAVLSRGTPTLLIANSRPENRVDIERWEIQEPGKHWAMKGADPVPYTAKLAFEAQGEATCGAPEERFAPFVAAHDETHAVFMALLNGQANPMRFERAPGASIAPVCGSCLPLALERSTRGLGLRIGVRRGLATDALKTPTEFSPDRDAATATASCARASVIVAYLASGKLMLQRTDPSGGWTFESARLLVEAKPGERLEEPKLAVLGDRAVLVWRRIVSAQRKLFFEFLVSDDGGRTFR